MNLKSLSLAVSTLLICSSAFATSLNIQVKNNANGELWQGGLNVQNVIGQGDSVPTNLKDGFTLTPMEFDAANQPEISGMVTVMVTRHNNIRIDCILSDGKNNKLTFIPYYYDGTKGKAFTCKPISEPQSKIIVNKDNVENMKIVYQKYGQ